MIRVCGVFQALGHYVHTSVCVCACVFSITSIRVYMNASVIHTQKIMDHEWSIAGHTRVFGAALLQENTSLSKRKITRTILYIRQIPTVVGHYFAISRWNVWDGLMVRVGIIIFHLFFILILLKRARRRQRGKLVKSVFLWCPGMFLRGVLEVGDGGPEERANKQVAEWGTRWVRR